MLCQSLSVFASIGSAYCFISSPYSVRSFAQHIKMSEKPTWTPPAKIEDLIAKVTAGRPPSMNSATAGARTERDLPVGSAALQLYSLGTPNGQKVGILLEELGVEYDAHFINIMQGDQFTSGFVGVNPNSKIPALLDQQGPDGAPINLFESGSIMVYLAEKYQRFIPTSPRDRAECFNWVFWQMAGLGPMTGNFGHFMVYAPADLTEARDYGVYRYGMETQRLCSVLDKHLSSRQYLVAETYTIADMIIYPWINHLFNGYVHASGVGAKDVLSMEQYVHVAQWADRVRSREAVQRGMTVCTKGAGKPWIELEEGK